MSEFPDSGRAGQPENAANPASSAVHPEGRVTSYLVTRFSYGAKGELLSLVRMTLRDSIVDWHEYSHYRDPDAA